MGELVRGVRDLGRAFAYARAHPTLWKWIVAPAVITFLLLAGVVIGAVALANPVVVWLTSNLPSWLETVASSILNLIVVGGLAIAGLLVFVAIAGIIAGPFNELLSEAVEELVTGRRAPRFSLVAFLRGAVQGLVHGLRRLVIAVIGIALVFALGFVPGVGTIAAALLGFWFAARAAAYDSFDAMLARRGLSYRRKLDYLAAHRGRTLGIGAGVAGLLLVPGVNLVALGLGAIAATLAAHELPDAPGTRQNSACASTPIARPKLSVDR